MELADYRKSEAFSNPYVIKCTLLGHHGVGKSTLGHMFATGRFDPTIESTIGIDFFTKTIELDNSKNQSIKLQIWDTAGQEKFKSIVKSYLRDVYITFIVFDITNRETWNDIDSWRNDLELENRKYGSIPRIVLVGSKSDKKNHVIREDEIKTKADKWGCNYYILSSKQYNSASMISRMFFLETEYLHRDIVYDYINKKEIPFGILKKDNKKRNIMYYDETDNNYKTNWCCFQ